MGNVPAHHLPVSTPPQRQPAPQGLPNATPYNSIMGTTASGTPWTIALDDISNGLFASSVTEAVVGGDNPLESPISLASLVVKLAIDRGVLMAGGRWVLLTDCINDVAVFQKFEKAVAGGYTGSHAVGATCGRVEVVYYHSLFPNTYSFITESGANGSHVFVMGTKSKELLIDTIIRSMPAYAIISTDDTNFVTEIARTVYEVHRHVGPEVILIISMDDGKITEAHHTLVTADEHGATGRIFVVGDAQLRQYVADQIAHNQPAPPPLPIIQQLQNARVLPRSIPWAAPDPPLAAAQPQVQTDQSMAQTSPQPAQPTPDQQAIVQLIQAALTAAQQQSQTVPAAPGQLQQQLQAALTAAQQQSQTAPGQLQQQSQTAPAAPGQLQQQSQTAPAAPGQLQLQAPFLPTVTYTAFPSSLLSVPRAYRPLESNTQPLAVVYTSPPEDAKPPSHATSSPSKKSVKAADLSANEDGSTTAETQSQPPSHASSTTSSPSKKSVKTAHSSSHEDGSTSTETHSQASSDASTQSSLKKGDRHEAGCGCGKCMYGDIDSGEDDESDDPTGYKGKRMGPPPQKKEDPPTTGAPSGQ